MYNLIIIILDSIYNKLILTLIINKTLNVYLLFPLDINYY